MKRDMNDEAIMIYEHVLELDPGYWQASYNLGCVYYKLGRYEEAETYLARSLAAQSNRRGSIHSTRSGLHEDGASG